MYFKEANVRQKSSSPAISSVVRPLASRHMIVGVILSPVHTCHAGQRTHCHEILSRHLCLHVDDKGQNCLTNDRLTVTINELHSKVLYVIARWHVKLDVQSFPL